MDDLYVGTILLWPLEWAPEGWLLCQGQALSVQDKKYELLYALLGTMYGGDGKNTFRLPDLRGRAVLGAGKSMDSVYYQMGETGGSETTTLTVNQLPMHTHGIADSSFMPFQSAFDGHLVNGKSEADIQLPPQASYLPGNLTSTPTSQTTLGVAGTFDGKSVYAYSTHPPDVQLRSAAATAIGTVKGTLAGNAYGTAHTSMKSANTGGGGASISVVQPFIALNYVICYDGDFPPRDWTEGSGVN